MEKGGTTEQVKNAELVHVGFGNMISVSKVVAIAHPNSAPMKRMVQEGKEEGLVVDLTSGRKTKAVIVMDSGHLVLAAIAPETITGRAAGSKGE
jgi:regulator of extracellular matrix RemA (YlzA/DUF370 family)